MAKKNNGRPKYIKTMWLVFGGLWVFIFLFFTLLSLGWLGWLGFMPSFEELENPRSLQASEVLSADGEVLGFIGLENRSNVTYDQISPNLINALVATEDVRFYKHSGIDSRSLFRVLFKTVIGRHGSSGGGSTITQQLAKNLFPRGHKSKIGVVFVKFKEWVVAVKLEHNYSKQEILAMYFNTVDFGSNAYGIKTAARPSSTRRPRSSTWTRPPCWWACSRLPPPTAPSCTPTARWSAATRCCTRCTNTTTSAMRTMPPTRRSPST